MAWALELVLARLPVGRAAQMSAARVNDKDAVGCAVHPNAVFLLPLGVHAESIIRGVANLENRGRFEERARKEKTEEGNEPGAEKRGDATPHQAPASFVGRAGPGADGRDTRGGCGFRRSHGRRTNITGRFRAAGSGRLCRPGFRFDRFGVRTRHAMPPG